MKLKLAVPVWLENERASIKETHDRWLAKAKKSAGMQRNAQTMGELLEVADLLASSKQMQLVWASLDKVVRACELPDCGPSLAHAVYFAKYDFKDFERMTPNERREYVAKVQRLSRELAKMLRPARQLSRLTWKRITAKGEKGIVPTGWPCPNFGCDWLPNSLEEVALAGDTWLEEFGPVVPRPNGNNAERLFVMRKLTQDFRRQLGQPMRRAVFEIVGTFYDVSDLSPGDVTKLAP